MLDPEGPILLLTRPEAASRRFAALPGLERAEIVISPLMEIVPVEGRIPPEQALIFSSQNGVAAFLDRAKPMGRLAWCVGSRTAQMAEAAGFSVLGWAETAAALVDRMQASGQGGPFLHLRGDRVAFPLAESLNQAGIETDQLVIYRQDPLPLTQQAMAVLTGSAVVIVPVFSPQTARILLAQIGQPRARLIFVAISDAVARICAAADLGKVVTAASPDAQAMRSAVLCQLDALNPG